MSRPARGAAGIAIAAIALAAFTTGCRSEGDDRADRSPPRAAPAADADPVELGGDRLADWHRFALNALLAPLLENDEGEALRWSEPTWVTPCADNSVVLVDSRPLLAGESVPERPFALRLRLDDCWPLGPESFGLSGVVEMELVRRADRIEARVDSRGLVLLADGRRATVSQPFTAVLGLGPATGRSASGDGGAAEPVGGLARPVDTTDASGKAAFPSGCHHESRARRCTPSPRVQPGCGLRTSSRPFVVATHLASLA